jgi:homoserine kinase
MVTERKRTHRRFAKAAVAAAIALAAVLQCACSTASLARVRPWQRAALADDIMNPDRDPLGAAVSEHVYFSREAASGGRGVGGAGCGCN